jgi:hypothetical protein
MQQDTPPGYENLRSVQTEITFLAPGSFVNRRFVSAGVEVNTGRYEPYEVEVHDGREIADWFTLDRNGFVLAKHVSAVRDFHDHEEVSAVYPDEAEAVVKALTGADLVTGRGWMVRTSGDIPKREKRTIGYEHTAGVQPPAAEAHVDFSPDFAEVLAADIYRESFPDQPPYKRFISSSLWRAFSPPPQDCPLALCDGSTVGRDEGEKNALVVVDEIPDEETMLGELEDGQGKITASVFHFNPEFRWWYFSNLTRDEVLLFKFHDSDEKSALRVPHTAFRDTSAAHANTRESIEFRSFAFFL